MMLKAIGAILILLSSSTAGYYFSMVDRFRIEELRQMRRALTILKGEISFSSAPLAEAFKEAAERVGGATALIFEEYAQNLAKKRGGSASHIWKEVLEQTGKDTYFDKEDLDAFLSFGRALGYLDRDQQCRQIDLTLSYIDKTEEILLAKSAKSTKIYRSMGVLGGALLTVVLL